MKILADYHTHTILSCGNNEKRRHAKGTIEENVLAAIDKGLEVMGFPNTDLIIISTAYLEKMLRKKEKK